MKRINVMVSDDAKEVLVTWKATRGCRTQDEALENLLIEFKTQRQSLSSLIDELDELRAKQDTRDAIMPSED